MLSILLRVLRLDWPKPTSWDTVQRITYELGKRGE